MSDMVNVKDFRANTKTYFDVANEKPVPITRNNKIYILMTKEHYVDLINKIKFPGAVQMPKGVHTIVHFTTQFRSSQ